MKRADTRLMKEINLNAVRRAMRSLETATKPQLAAETGLSVVTVAALVRELEECGELIAEEGGASTGGRPAAAYRFDYRRRLALVMHLHEQDGVDTVFASVIDLRGETLLRASKPFGALNRKKWIGWIGEMLPDFPNVRVIVLGIPGQTSGGRISVSSHKRLKGMDPAGLLQASFGLPVLLENDVNAALRGCLERQFAGKMNDSGLVLGLYFPDKYPPGMGIALNGTLIGGKNGMAGEIKYLPLDVDWSVPPQGAEFGRVVCRLIHTVCAVLAPDRIVLYETAGRIASGEWEKTWNAYRLCSPLPAEPDIVCSSAFAEDFAAGLRSLALRELEPKPPLVNE